MKRYGHVIFKIGEERGAELQRKLLERMRNADIIILTDDQLERYYREDMRMYGGCEHHIVLHGWREARRFRKIMQDPELDYDPDISWEITKKPESDKFREWLEHKGEERKMISKRD